MRQITLSVFLAVILANAMFSQIVLVANLEGSQEVPAVTTTAKGTAWLVINTDYRTVTYQVTYARLQGNFTASHFHLAPAGTNGPVVKAISFNGNTSSGTWTDVPDSIISKLIKGQVYVNVHSSSFTGGEIRGQLMVAKGVAHVVDLTGTQEVPANTSTARGTGYLVLDSTGLTANYRITIAGLSSAYSASHIHLGAAGVNGGVVKAISFTDSTSEGSWTGQTNQNLVDLVKNKLYFNVHTANFPGGEIRGQILQTGTISFVYELDGTQEVPAVTTTGKGTGFAILTPTKDTLYYYLAFARLSSPVTGSHVHLGPSGVSGPVAFPIVMFTPNYTAAFGQIVIDSLIGYALRGGLYANIHTSTNPGGEIRGQIRPAIGIAFQSNPAGVNEVPSVLTTARGAGSLIYSPELNSLRYRFTVAGLSSNLTASHFHYGPVGTNGGVQNAIAFNGDSTTSGSWDNIKDSVLTGLLNGKYYFNAHTTNNPGGEIRGQITSFKYILRTVPVELTSFNALTDGMTAKLTWTAATEKNNMGFAIERGTDGITFKQCGFIKGNGSATSEHVYNYSESITDPGVYFYRLKQVDYDGTIAYSNVVNVTIASPGTFTLLQNYPNPFNPSTTIAFTIPERSNVSLVLFDMLGRQVKSMIDENREAGLHTVHLNAADLASGIYFYELKAGSLREVKKLTLLK